MLISDLLPAEAATVFTALYNSPASTTQLGDKQKTDDILSQLYTYADDWNIDISQPLKTTLLPFLTDGRAAAVLGFDATPAIATLTKAMSNGGLGKIPMLDAAQVAVLAAAIALQKSPPAPVETPAPLPAVKPTPTPVAKASASSPATVNDLSGIGWTEGRAAEARKLWVQGLSASQIAKKIGRVTRSAVLGKMHRIGLGGRATPSRPVKRPPQMKIPHQKKERVIQTDNKTAAPAKQKAVYANSPTAAKYYQPKIDKLLSKLEVEDLGALVGLAQTNLAQLDRYTAPLASLDHTDPRDKKLAAALATLEGQGFVPVTPLLTCEQSKTIILMNVDQHLAVTMRCDSATRNEKSELEIPTYVSYFAQTTTAPQCPDTITPHGRAFAKNLRGGKFLIAMNSKDILPANAFATALGQLGAGKPQPWQVGPESIDANGLKFAAIFQTAKGYPFDPRVIIGQDSRQSTAMVKAMGIIPLAIRPTRIVLETAIRKGRQPAKKRQANFDYLQRK